MERWNSGMLEYWVWKTACALFFLPIIPEFQHSIILRLRRMSEAKSIPFILIGPIANDVLKDPMIMK
jgi:hypothetical protein